MSQQITRALFGGAITAITPTRLVDASDLRVVPDTQEVFLYPESSVSIIIEVLERVGHSDYTDAIKFHFDSLAHDNSAVSSEVNNVIIIPNDRGDDTPSPIVLTGMQLVPKFNRTNPDQVRILMGVYRVESKAVDLVVTSNIPMRSDDGGAVDEAGFVAAQADFNKLVSSLKIVDLGLFA